MLGCRAFRQASWNSAHRRSATFLFERLSATASCLGGVSTTSCAYTSRLCTKTELMGRQEHCEQGLPHLVHNELDHRLVAKTCRFATRGSSLVVRCNGVGHLRASHILCGRHCAMHSWHRIYKPHHMARSSGRERWRARCTPTPCILCNSHVDMVVDSGGRPRLCRVAVGIPALAPRGALGEVAGLRHSLRNPGRQAWGRGRVPLLYGRRRLVASKRP